ncbi:MAG: hypothetical protein CMH57_07465 [Myxococcales bacterium]|nr:hypothetical protein [Myxococcales bacterium]
MSHEHERRWKEEQLRQILGRYGPPGASSVPLDWVDAGERLGHRARGSFRVGEAGALTLGLRSTRVDGSLADVRDCPAQSERFRALMTRVADVLETHGRAGVEQVGIWTCEETGMARVVVQVGSTSTRLPWKEPLRALTGGASVEVIVTGEEGEIDRWGPAWRVRVAPGVEVEAPLGSWLHATPRVARLLGRWVTQRLRGHARVLDLCCGLGTMTFRLAAQAEHVIAVDEDYHGCMALQRAATRAGMHIEVRPGRVGQALRKLRRELHDKPRPTAAVINPMRRPLGEGQLSELAALGVRHALYLGPSPVSAARDARVMAEMGFTITRAAGVNLHPATGQVMLALELSLHGSSGGA